MASVKLGVASELWSTPLWRIKVSANKISFEDAIVEDCAKSPVNDAWDVDVGLENGCVTDGSIS